MRREWINSVHRLRNLPTHIGRHARLLPKSVAFPNKTRPPRSVARVQQIDLSGVAVRDQARTPVDRTVTIDTSDGRGVARLTVKHAVAVNIDQEMAIAALHAVREVHVFQVHRFRELFRIAIVDLAVVDIE